MIGACACSSPRTASPAPSPRPQAADGHRRRAGPPPRRRRRPCRSCRSRTAAPASSTCSRPRSAGECPAHGRPARSATRVPGRRSCWSDGRRTAHGLRRVGPGRRAAPAGARRAGPDPDEPQLGVGRAHRRRGRGRGHPRRRRARRLGDQRRRRRPPGRPRGRRPAERLGARRPRAGDHRGGRRSPGSTRPGRASPESTSSSPSDVDCRCSGSRVRARSSPRRRGATPEQAQRLEAALGHFASVVARVRPPATDLLTGSAMRPEREPGAGAGRGDRLRAAAARGPARRRRGRRCSGRSASAPLVAAADLVVTRRGLLRLAVAARQGGRRRSPPAASEVAVPAVVLAGQVLVGRREAMTAGLSGVPMPWPTARAGARRRWPTRLRPSPPGPRGWPAPGRRRPPRHVRPDPVRTAPSGWDAGPIGSASYHWRVGNRTDTARVAHDRPHAPRR